MPNPGSAPPSPLRFLLGLLSPALLSCGTDASPTATENETRGALEMFTVTTGDDRDPGGYTVTVGEETLALYDGSGLGALTRERGSRRRSDLAADGTQVAFVSSRTGDPDGTRIAFGSNHDGGLNSDIWVIGSDGSDPTPWRPTSSRPGAPRPAPEPSGPRRSA